MSELSTSDVVRLATTLCVTMHMNAWFDLIYVLANLFIGYLFPIPFLCYTTLNLLYSLVHPSKELVQLFNSDEEDVGNSKEDDVTGPLH